MTPSFVRMRAACVLSIASLVLVACGGNNNTASTQNLAADQTLKFPILDDFGTLDPAMVDAETDQEIGQNLFSGLLKLDNNLAVAPDIADKLPTVSADGLTYTFTMRKDVTFSNGDKVTAKDVLYSWNRAAAMQGSYSTNFTPIAGYDDVAKNTASGAKLQSLLEKSDASVVMKGLTAPDGPTGYTVKVAMSTQAGWWLSAIALSASTGMLVDQNAVKQDFDNWWAKPETAIGTGPFKMTARTPKATVDFEQVANWWGTPKPTLKKIHLDVISSASSAIAKYEQGGYDIYGYGGYSNAPVEDVIRIKGAKNSKELLLHTKVRTTWVSFNVVADAKRPAKGPFLLADGQQAHDLRLAFALAVDKKKLVSVVCHDIVCSPATGGLISKGLKGYGGDDSDPLAKYDPARAKQLFQSADPQKTKTQGLTYSYDTSNPLNKPAAEFLQDQWSTNLGVKVDLQPLSHSQFIKARLKGSYVLSRDGWQADYDHPQDWYDNLWGKVAGCPDSNCSTGYNKPEYDTILAKADAIKLEQALPEYAKLAKMLQDDAIYIPLYYSVGAFLFKPYVKGAGTNNFFDYPWSNIQILQH